MTQDERMNRMVDIMKRSEMDSRAQEHLRVFLFSLIEDPQFNDEELMDIFDADPDMFDGFCRCFEAKYRFFDQGGDQGEWDYLLGREKSLLDAVK
jgi:hypothetical protein